VGVGANQQTLVSELLNKSEILALDGENLGAVLRIRAAKATQDLASHLLWVMVMVSYGCRLPLAHALCRVQKMKKGNGTITIQ
jgi:beta-lactamase regulating signal transducer with metallopeptidase domain